MEVARDCFYAAETYEDGLVILPETRGSSFLKKAAVFFAKEIFHQIKSIYYNNNRILGHRPMSYGNVISNFIETQKTLETVWCQRFCVFETLKREERKFALIWGIKVAFSN